MTEATTKKTRRREIIHEPGTGRKAVKIFGYVLFAFGVLGFILTFLVAVSANMTPFVLVIPLLFMIIGYLLAWAGGRTKKEVITETIETEEDDEEWKEDNK